jgi:hypothetical protein
MSPTTTTMFCPPRDGKGRAEEDLRIAHSIRVVHFSGVLHSLKRQEQGRATFTQQASRHVARAVVCTGMIKQTTH